MEVIFNCLYNRKTGPLLEKLLTSARFIHKLCSRTLPNFAVTLNGVLVTQLAKLVQQHACLIQGMWTSTCCQNSRSRFSYCQIIFNSVVKMPPLNAFASGISYRDISWNLLMTSVCIFSHQMLVIHFLSCRNWQAFYCVAHLAQQTLNVHLQQWTGGAINWGSDWHQLIWAICSKFRKKWTERHCLHMAPAKTPSPYDSYWLVCWTVLAVPCYYLLEQLTLLNVA